MSPPNQRLTPLPVGQNQIKFDQNDVSYLSPTLSLKKKKSSLTKPPQTNMVKPNLMYQLYGFHQMQDQSNKRMFSKRSSLKQQKPPIPMNTELPILGESFKQTNNMFQIRGHSITDDPSKLVENESLSNDIQNFERNINVMKKSLITSKAAKLQPLPVMAGQIQSNFAQ